MGILSEADLSWMRETQEEALDETAEVEVLRASKVADGAGGRTTSWATVASYPARLALPRSREGLVADRMTEMGELVLTLPFDADIEAQDRVLTRGTTYEVLEISSRETWHTAKQVRLGAPL